MPRIQQMPDSLANQIAAGEVVERPASVVKELIENAIDAQASEITIEVKEAGIQQIIVTDNGQGMHPEDLPKAFLPYATSKVYRLDDLFQIHSLGFRGEALASIGSVAKVRVDTGHEVDGSLVGAYILVEGSQIQEEGSSIARQGTSVQVDSLFYNTPARLKHLSSLRTEMRHILTTVQRIGLAHPEIRLRLLSEGEPIFHTTGSGQLKQAFANVYQPKIARQMLQVQAQDHDFKLSGYISPPTITRGNRYYIHWLINGRVVDHFALSQVLTKAYDKQLMIGRYPLAVIQIEMDPRLVDVNMHPTKQTVRLSKEDQLSHLLTQAIQETLQAHNPVPKVNYDQLSQEAQAQFKRPPLPNPETMPLDLTSSKETVLSAVEEETQLYHAPEDLESQPQEKPRESWEDSQEESTQPEADLNFLDLRYVGQIHGTYLIAESAQGFYLIDQHAAQERIRYERFMQEDEGELVYQELLVPFLIDLSAEEQALVEEYQEELQALGLHLTTFGPKTYQMDRCPTWLVQEDLDTFLVDLLGWLKEHQDLSIKKIKEASIIMQSCRGAIKANEYLPDLQAEALIRDMADLEDPYHCPHGRPIFIEFDQLSIEKLFKRIQD